MARMCVVVASAVCAGVFLGCASGFTATDVTTTVISTGTYAGAGFTGRVLAGSNAVAGANVLLYAAGTTGNGSTPTPLLTKPVTTDSQGSFTVPAGYECPLSGSVLYVVATGGRVGGTPANTAVVLMTSLGMCGAVAANASYVIDELTTVGSAYAFAQFLARGAQLGASATNPSGIALAAGTLANLVNLTSGVGAGAAFPATGVSPLAKLNTLANALNACTVSGSPGSTACSGLFSSAAGGGAAPSNTLDAALALVKSQGTGVASVYALSNSSSAYAPVLSAAPADWTLFVTFKGGGMNDPSAVSIDSKGQVWVANYFAAASLFSNTGTPIFSAGLTGNGLGSVYGGAVDANDAMWLTNEPASSNNGANSVTVLTAAGSAVSGSPYVAGGLNYPIAVAVDLTDVSWVVDYGNSHLTLLSNGGTPLSGANGYSGVDATGTGNFVFPVAVAVDTNRYGWVANQSSNTVTKVAADGSSYVSYVTGGGPSGVAVDAENNVWVANYFGNSVGVVTASRKVLSSTSGYTGGGIVHPQGIAADALGNVWVANYRGPSLSEVAGVGSSPGAGTMLSPGAGWAPDAGLLEAYGLAIDASGNIWVTSFGSNTLTEFIGLAAPVKTPLLGAVRTP